MKNIKLFRTKKEYENYVFSEVFKEKAIKEHPFYRRLIQFVIDSRSPIFYFQTDPAEHANFSGYYNLQLIRETYINSWMSDMYFLHDFTHLLFYYPHDMSSVTQAEFDDVIILGEYAASNETEILAHYRIPELRPKVLQDRRILFDILKERNVPMPPVQSLFHLRKLLIETDILDPYFYVKPEDYPIRDTFHSYQGNRAWCKQRYTESIKLKNPTEYFYKFLTPLNYERIIKDYESHSGQEEYEKITLMNVRLAFAILGLDHPPRTFEECFEKVKELEGKVLLKS